MTFRDLPHDHRVKTQRILAEHNIELMDLWSEKTEVLQARKEIIRFMVSERVLTTGEISDFLSITVQELSRIYNASIKENPVITRMKIDSINSKSPFNKPVKTKSLKPKPKSNPVEKMEDHTKKQEKHSFVEKEPIINEKDEFFQTLIKERDKQQQILEALNTLVEHYS